MASLFCFCHAINQFIANTPMTKVLMTSFARNTSYKIFDYVCACNDFNSLHFTLIYHRGEHNIPKRLSAVIYNSLRATIEHILLPNNFTWEWQIDKWHRAYGSSIALWTAAVCATCHVIIFIIPSTPLKHHQHAFLLATSTRSALNCINTRCHRPVDKMNAMEWKVYISTGFVRVTSNVFY